MKAVRPALALLAALFITSCGGGGGGSNAVSPAAPGASGSASQQKTVTGKVVLSIPTQASSGKVRYPQFVSPNASSVSIVANGGTAQIFDVSATSSLCTTTSGARNCTLTFGAPVGNDTIVLTIFSGPNGDGTTLATTTTTTTVVAGTPFSLTVAMTASIGTIVVNIATQTGQNNCPNGTFLNTNGINEGCAGSSGTITFTAFDPSGAQITGSAPYATPILITTNDPSLSVAPNQITGPGQTAIASYNGAAFGPSVTNTAIFTLTIGSQAITSTVPILRQYLYVANSNSPPGSTPPGGGNVAVYTYGSSGSATPARLLSGASTGISNPVSLLEDSSGNLYVLDNGPYTTQSNPLILVFAQGANGNVAPARKITGITSVDSNNACESMTFDPTNQFLFVTCDDQHIHVFTAATNGTATSAQTASLGYCDGACFQHPIGLVFDATGNLYVADAASNNAIFEFARPLPTSGGAVSINGLFSNSMSGPGGSWPSNVNPAGLGIDQAGRLYASILNFSSSGPPDANNQIAIWNSSRIPCNNCTPSGYLYGTPLSTHAPAGFAIDAAGNLYVGNPFTNQVSVFANSTVVAGSAAATNNPAVLRTFNTGSSPDAPTGMIIGP